MRIVSLLPSATEILFAIGAGNEVAGVTHVCDFPPEAVRLPKLTAAAGPQLRDPAAIDRHVRDSVHAGSSLYHLDSALLQRLDPDLIVTQELCEVCAVSYGAVERAAKELQSHSQRGGTRIVSLEPASVDDVLATISFLGDATGHAAGAESLTASLRTRIEALECRPSRQSHRPRTLTLEWTDPPMSAGHWIPELVALAGGDPILAHPGANSQRLTWDAIARAQPEAVIVSPCGFDLDATHTAIGQLDGVAQWRDLRARLGGRVLAMDGNAYLSRPGPRLVEAAEIMGRWYTTVAEYAG